MHNETEFWEHITLPWSTPSYREKNTSLHFCVCSSSSRIETNEKDVEVSSSHPFHSHMLQTLQFHWAVAV